MHDDEVRKKHRDIQDNDGAEEISQNINGAAEADNVEKKGTHSVLLEKQTSYYGVQDVKEKAYDSVLRRKELQKQNGTRSGKLIFVISKYSQVCQEYFFRICKYLP